MIILYIKTHNITGLKYFGKTTRNVYDYKGSGKYWLSHLKKHGNDVTTEIVAQFEDNDQSSCEEYALNFSIENNIVESKEWANLILEDGLRGFPVGNKLSEITKNKISKTLVGKPSPKSKYIMKEPISVRSERSRITASKTIWINNGIVCKRHKGSEELIPKGWIIGRIQTGNIGCKTLGQRNDGNNTRGRRIYNNGKIHAYYFEGQQPVGWIRGKMEGFQGGTGALKKGKKYNKQIRICNE